MKSDAAFIRAVERAHVIERHVAATLRAHGLEALTQSTGTRADHSGIAAYAHDIDLDVAGYRCQYKHRTCALANLLTTVGHPIVDERIKADRTPVDFYILRFEDTALVVPYAPKSWRTILRFDYVDDSHKTYYVVSPDACIPYVMWVQWLIYHQNQQPTSTETLP